MADFGTVAAQPRLSASDLPVVQSVKVVPDGTSRNGRDVHRWEADSYGTMKVGVYLPVGMTLPKGGVTITPAQFDKRLGTDKPRKGTAVAVYRDETVNNGEEGRDRQVLSIYIEAPAKGYAFESITIAHA